MTPPPLSPLSLSSLSLLSLSLFFSLFSLTDTMSLFYFTQFNSSPSLSNSFSIGGITWPTHDQTRQALRLPRGPPGE